MKPIAHIRTDLPQKFGIPRNSFLAPHLRGRIVLEPEYALESAVSGIESFSHLWLIWQFENGVPGGTADDIAAESRQYRTDAPAEFCPMDSLVKKFQNMDNCSVLYDFYKKRVDYIIEQIKEYDAKGLLIVMTKFCDPEEFDYPLIKKACEAAGIPTATIEVDRQMVNYEQARTAIETFRDVLA